MKIIIEKKFSTILQSPQRIFIGLPDNYTTSTKYPVLYMQDGQNVFDLRHHAIHDWCVNRLFDELKIQWIIVAIESPTTPAERFNLYYPWQVTGIENFLPSEDFPKDMAIGGEGQQYANFIVQELIPYIEANFSTCQQRAIAGSSLGGALSLYTASQHPIFEIVGVLSPAFWFDRERFLAYCAQVDFSAQHIYLSIGTDESSDPEMPSFPKIYTKEASELAELLFEQAGSLVFQTIEGGTHEGRSWHIAMKNFIQTYLMHTQEEK